MNMNKISAAVTAVLSGLVVSTAFALPASDYNSTPGDTLDVYVSGASAQDGALERLFRNSCNTGTLDIFRDGSNQRVMFCRISSTGVPGFPGGAGQKVAIYKTSEGGSGNGVQPVANSTTLGFIDMAAVKANSICTTSTAVAAETVSGVTFAGYNDHTSCTQPLAQKVPDAGISDVEPKLVGASDGENAKLSVTSQNAVVWGVPVTEGLRNALQKVQGLTVGAEDEVNMPSMTFAQLSSIYSGQFSDWSLMVDSTGESVPFSAGVTAPADTNVYLCRRVSTSGTQASFGAHFLRERCASGVLGMPLGNDGGVIGAGTVNEGSGTSNVKTCLTTHDGANRWAVGMFSTENVASTQTAAVNDGNVWRFIKINGYAPTLLNTANGKHDFISEQSIQWRNSVSGNALSGLKLTLMQDTATNAGKPDIIKALNASFAHSWGKGGVMALVTNGHFPTIPSAGLPLTAAQVDANPVMTSSKSLSGTPNNCSPATTVLPVDVSTKF